MFQQIGILGLFMAVAAGAAVFNTARYRAAMFDDQLTPLDQQRLTALAIFVLVPLSVLLHEGGHALTVKAFGGEITGFGFYLFYGYVEHRGIYTPLQLAVIAVSGTALNVALGLAALALAWRRPRRAGVNYLLFVFGGFELANALIFYPVLDALGGVAGDWGMIYSRATPVFSSLIGLNHLALLVAALLVWRNPRFKQGYFERIGQSTESRPVVDDVDARQIAMSALLLEAAEAATADWKHVVTLAPDAQAGGAQVVLRWESGGFQRALLAHANLNAEPAHRIELHAAIKAVDPGAAPIQRSLARISGEPTATRLAPHLRHFLDLVDSWTGTSLIMPN